MKDFDKTEINKTFIKNFIDDILVNGRMEKLASSYDGDKHIQHNPLIPDRLSGLCTTLEILSKKGIFLTYKKITKC